MEDEMEGAGAGDMEQSRVKSRSMGSGGDPRPGSFGNGENERYDDEGRRGNDRLAKVPMDPISMTEEVENKSDSGEEEGEIEDEEEDVKTDEAVEEAANAWLKKGEEAKKKELLGFGYKIRPDLDAKFRPGDVQIVIEKIVRDHLDGQTYDAEEMPKMVKVITAEIQAKVKELKYNRYKLVTYVIMGERRGEGISASTRCIWDVEADCSATHTFLNETIFCCATVYGIFYY